MKRAPRRRRRAARAPIGAPLIWTFDGPFARCLADIEDTLRRAIVQVGDVSRRRRADRRCRCRRCKRRVDAGRRAATGVGRSSSSASSHRYGLPAPPRVRHSRTAGPARHAGHRLQELAHVAQGMVAGQGSRTGRARRRVARRPRVRDGAQRRRARGASRRTTRRDAGRAREAAPRARTRRWSARSARSSSDFVASQLRLHLAIAERDRYVLTSIEVACERRRATRAACCAASRASSRPSRSSATSRARSSRGLPNASAIDLSQFAGLNVERPTRRAPATIPYDDADRRAPQRHVPDAGPRPFDVTLVGRWVHGDALGPTARARRSPAARRPRRHAARRARGVASRSRTRAGAPARRAAARRCPAAATRSARTRAATSSSTASTRAGAIASSGSTTTPGGSRDAGSTNGIRVEAGAGGRRARAASAPTAAQRARARARARDRALGARRKASRATIRACASRCRTPTRARAGADTDVTARAAPSTPIAPPQAAGPVARADRAHGLGRARRVDSPTRRCRSASAARATRRWCRLGARRRVRPPRRDRRPRRRGRAVVVHGDNGVTVDGVDARARARSSAGSAARRWCSGAPRRRAGVHAHAGRAS